MVSVELDVADQAVLVRGLKAAGFRVNVVGNTLYAYNRQGQQVTIRGGRLRAEEGVAERLAGQVKRAYATEAVKTAAAKYGFKVTYDAKQPQHITLNRKAF
jgi:hypothetical protein